jgi:hypothetical protein
MSDLTTKTDPSVVLLMVPAIMSYVLAPTMIWAAAQAGVQCDPGVLIGNLISPYENQVCPREGGSSHEDT